MFASIRLTRRPRLGISILIVVALVLALGATYFATGTLAPKLASYTAADRSEQTRYAYETINLSHSAFVSRKADFAAKGCRKENYENNGFAYPGCMKPSPYNAFNWTDDGCSGREKIGFVSNIYRDLFNQPCQLHDFGYRNFGKGLTLGRNEKWRKYIDDRFKEEMFRLCRDKYGNQAQLSACYVNAKVVYDVVRRVGDNWDTLPIDPLAPLQPPTSPVGQQPGSPTQGPGETPRGNVPPASTPACTFTDAGSGTAIQAARGSTFTDSRGFVYKVGDRCGLVEQVKPICTFTDAGDGEPIVAARGSTFTDSRGYTYRVDEGCGLIEKAKPACTYTDAGNGKPIEAARGSTFTDSRGYTYRVDEGCGLIEKAKPACTYTDAGNGKPIEAARGSTFTDSREISYQVDDNCNLTPVG